MERSPLPSIKRRNATLVLRWLVPAVCLGVLTMAAGGCSREALPAAAAKPPLPVTVVEARAANVPHVVEAVAQVEGPLETEVRARVGGMLMKRLYKEGSFVKSGQPLFQIDRASYEIALAQARAQLAERQTRLDQTNRESERLKGLLLDQAISQKEYDDAISNRSMAQAGLAAAEAAARQAELNLSYTTVTAPIAGMSGRAQRTEGNLIAAGGDGLLTTVVQINPLWARFSIAEDDLAVLRISPSAPVQAARVDAILPNDTVYPLPGRLNFEARQIDARLATIQMRAEFDNPEVRLLPGQFLRIRLTGGGRKAVLLPMVAVSQGETGRFVYVVGSDNTAQLRPIKTDGWHENQWVVLSGVKPGEKVIVDNLLKLRPGQTVSIDAKPAQAAQAKS